MADAAMAGAAPAPMVLIVDDEEELREEIALTLCESDMPAIAAGTVEQAIEALTQHRSILVMLSDIRMPEHDGFDLMGHVRLFCTGRFAVETVLFTGHGGMQEARQAEASWAAGFLRKPVRLEELRRTLLAAAEIARQRRLAAATPA